MKGDGAGGDKYRWEGGRMWDKDGWDGGREGRRVGGNGEVV